MCAAIPAKAKHSKKGREELFAAWTKQVNYLISLHQETNTSGNKQVDIAGRELLGTVPLFSKGFMGIPADDVQAFAIDFVRKNPQYNVSVGDDHKPGCACQRPAEVCWHKLSVKWD